MLSNYLLPALCLTEGEYTKWPQSYRPCWMERLFLSSSAVQENILRTDPDVKKKKKREKKIRLNNAN